MCVSLSVIPSSTGREGEREEWENERKREGGRD